MPPAPTPPTSIDLLAELRWRGMLQAASEGLEARLARGPISGYVGFDPSGPSLHIGHLVQVFLLTHLQRAGGRPVAVVGGGTGMIGDPSGRNAERNLLDAATLEANTATLRTQLDRFLDFAPGPSGAVMVDNRDWLDRYSLLEFLRQIGKHFTVAYMLGKESVEARLGSGLSFTEFSYMTLQATDFLHLWREHGVELQMGGADQWGNITAGLELIRRVAPGAAAEEPAAFALCSPLLLNERGEKMGKTAGGAVFLDPSLTPPFAFFQYCLNQEDAVVGRLLRTLTLLPQDEIVALEAEQASQPEARSAQRAFAFDLTSRVHGEAVAKLQAHVSEAAFSGRQIDDPEVLTELHAHAEGFDFAPELLAAGPLAVATASGVSESAADARRLIRQGGLTINGLRLTGWDDPAPEPIAGEWLVVRRGKRQVRVGRLRRG